MKHIIVPGQIFGRLTVIGKAERDKHGNPHWLCLCECGNRNRPTQQSLTSGRSKSCGCFQRDTAKIQIHKTGIVPEYSGKRYKRICIKGHPEAFTKDGQLHEHRYLATKALGRPLPNGTQVHHHANGKSGNSIVICQDALYHKLLHIRWKSYLATGNANNRQCVFCKQWDKLINLTTHNSIHRTNGRFFHHECSKLYNHNYKRKTQ